MTNYPIYLDFNATTPVHPIVLEAMLPFFGPVFGNPSSCASIWVSAANCNGFSQGTGGRTDRCSRRRNRFHQLRE